MSQDNVQVTIAFTPAGRGIGLPEYATDLSAGMDLKAAIPTQLQIEPRQRALVPTGIMISLPQGYEAQIRPRSGLALHNGIAILNSPGTIDADYRGEIQVIMANLGSEPVVIERGQRIAQMVVAPVSHVEWLQTESLDDTDRGTGGFGHTGM